MSGFACSPGDSFMPGLRCFFLFSLVPLLSAIAFTADANDESKLFLRQNWFIQSSDNLHADGAAISTTGFLCKDWYPATLPSTVLNALVNDKVYPDPYAGMNLRSIPGTTYPIFEDFSNLMMPPASPFRHSWWYRTEFSIPSQFKGKTLSLGFDGINYKANVWMNGFRVASSDQ